MFSAIEIINRRERDRRDTTDGMYGRRGHVKWVVGEEKGEGGL